VEPVFKPFFDIPILRIIGILSGCVVRVRQPWRVSDSINQAVVLNRLQARRYLWFSYPRPATHLRQLVGHGRRTPVGSQPVIGSQHGQDDRALRPLGAG